MATQENIDLMDQSIIPHVLGMTAAEVEGHIDDITAFLEAGSIGPMTRDQLRVWNMLAAVWRCNPEMHEEWSR